MMSTCRFRLKGSTLSDEEELLARVRRHHEDAAAAAMKRYLVVDFQDGDFFAGMLQTVNGQKAHTLTCVEPMQIAFHTGKPGEACVDEPIVMSEGCQVRRGEDCTVKCIVVEVIGESRLLYIQRKGSTNLGSTSLPTPVWYLRRTRTLRPPSGSSVGRRSRGHGPDRSI